MSGQDRRALAVVSVPVATAALLLAGALLGERARGLGMALEVAAALLCVGGQFLPQSALGRVSLGTMAVGAVLLAYMFRPMTG